MNSNGIIFLAIISCCCLPILLGLIDEDGMPVVAYTYGPLQPKQNSVSNFLNPLSRNNEIISKSSFSSGTSLASSINFNPISLFLNLLYYGQYLAPGLLPIIFSVTNFGKSLQCWVSIVFSMFFISEWTRTGLYPFLPFALNFSDYYPRFFSCIFLMIVEHLCVASIAYHFSMVAWSPDGPAWRESYGFHKKATFSTLEILLGWDPSPYYAHIFVFSYAVFKYCGFVALEYKARKYAAGGRFPLLASLIKLQFIPLILSRFANIISGFVLLGLFLQFLFSLLSTNEIIIFFSIFFHQPSNFSLVSTLSISCFLIIVGFISHLL